MLAVIFTKNGNINTLKQVYCIVVTYNGMPWIHRCFESLINSTVKCNIICIDNCSADNTVNYITENFPQVQLVQSPTNAGFGQANNIGLRLALNASADYIFLLNQDAAVDADTIQKLAEVQMQQPAYGIISPVHFNGADTQLDQYFSSYLAASDIPASLSIESIIQQKKDLLINTNFVNAAAWLISKECIKKVGGFDPIFYHYGEDNNYVQRASYHNFATGIYTGCRIYHDRENQLNNTELTPGKQLRKEWIFFLTNACDINRKGIVLFVTKRFLRHCILSFTSMCMLSKKDFSFHSGMAKSILAAAIPISKSRAMAVRNDCMPFL